MAMTQPTLLNALDLKATSPAGVLQLHSVNAGEELSLLRPLFLSHEKDVLSDVTGEGKNRRGGRLEWFLRHESWHVCHLLPRSRCHPRAARTCGRTRTGTQARDACARRPSY